MFYFTPLAGVLFTFPSRYCFSIGHTVVFSLTSWSRLIHTGFLGLPCYSGFSTGGFYFRLQDFYLLWCSFQLLRLTSTLRYNAVPLPHSAEDRWFRLFPLRSPLLGESLLFSLPPATKMFQFTGFAHFYLCSQ